MPGTESAPLQGSYRLQAAKDSNHAIVFTRVWNRVDVRTCADCGECSIRTSPAHESVSNRIMPQSKIRFLALRLEPLASFRISRRKNNSSNRRRWRFRNQGESFDLRYQPGPVNFEVHVCRPSSG